MPDNPIQIADAALYLWKTKPALGIKDLYELTSAQLDAAVALLKQQRPLVKKYWGLASDEIDLVQERRRRRSAPRGRIVPQLIAAKAQGRGRIPKEGVTGWPDTWMLVVEGASTRTAPTWMQYISTPKAQASRRVLQRDAGQQEGVRDHDARQARARRSADAPRSYYRRSSSGRRRSPIAVTARRTAPT